MWLVKCHSCPSAVQTPSIDRVYVCGKGRDPCQGTGNFPGCRAQGPSAGRRPFPEGDGQVAGSGAWGRQGPRGARRLLSARFPVVPGRSVAEKVPSPPKKTPVMRMS